MTGESESVARVRELMLSFRQVHRSMTSLMRVQADRLGLTPVQMLVVRTLAEEPNLSLGELSGRIQLCSSTVSGVVKRLVESGCVERNRLDEDQRIVAIHLTEKGRQLAIQAYGDGSLISQALGRFLELPDRDVQALLELHKELIRVLNAR